MPLLTILLFVQQPVQVASKKTSEFHINGPLWREFTDHWWISLTKASNLESIFMSGSYIRNPALSLIFVGCMFLTALGVSLRQKFFCISQGHRGLTDWQVHSTITVIASYIWHCIWYITEPVSPMVAQRKPQSHIICRACCYLNWVKSPVDMQLWNDRYTWILLVRLQSSPSTWWIYG